MKGFIKDGKFHPIKSYSKVRKSRDQTAKTQGVRLQREQEEKPLTTDFIIRNLDKKYVAKDTGFVITGDQLNRKINHLTTIKGTKIRKELKRWKVQERERKGRWDDQQRFAVVKTKGGFKKWLANDNELEWNETKNLGEAIKAVEQGEGNLIVDLDTGNYFDQTLKKRDVKE